MAVDVPGHGDSMGQRFLAEMRQYASASLYLWVCFSVLVMYKTAILRAQGVPFVSLGQGTLPRLLFSDPDSH